MKLPLLFDILSSNKESYLKAARLVLYPSLVLFIIACIFATWFLVEGILWFKKVIPQMKKEVENINTAN